MRTVRQFLFLVILIALSTAHTASQMLVYPPSDPAKDIATALAAAKASGKHVLIDFGADWCPDCRVLGALFEDPQVAPFIKENFHVIRVDIGRRDKNADIVAKYGATSGDWIPAVVVLDGDGKTVGLTTDQLRLTRKDTPATLLPILQQWAPKKINGVSVTLTLEGDSSGPKWLSATFVPAAADVHLYSKDLPAAGIAGLGRPTRVVADAGSSVQIVGVGVADREIQLDVVEQLNVSVPIYPAGPVTLRFPVKRSGRGPAVFRVSYMGCGERGCLAPVTNRLVSVALPLTAARER